jgi:hypothetical protein
MDDALTNRWNVISSPSALSMPTETDAIEQTTNACRLRQHSLRLSYTKCLSHEGDDDDDDDDDDDEDDGDDDDDDGDDDGDGEDDDCDDDDEDDDGNDEW